MVWYFVVGINVIAVIIFLFLVFHYKKKWDGIKHYEKIRDKVTVREEEKDVTGEAIEGFSFPWGNLIGGFIVLLVGINIISAVSDEVTNSQANVTGLPDAATIILEITPLFFPLVIVMVGIGLAIGGLRRGGLV